jgi:hypothetical protein
MGGIWGILTVLKYIKTGNSHWKTADNHIPCLMILGFGKTNVKVQKK